MCSASKQSKWKIIISRHLGKSVAKKWRQLSLDILAVDSGVKPAYLYDIGQPVSHKVKEFVIEAVNESLIENYLNIVEIGMDCLILRPDSVRQIKETFDLQTEIIDITNESSSVIVRPEAIKAQLNEAINDIAANMVLDKVHLYSLSDSIHCNRTSLFGVMLGYPVVYWFDEHKNKTQNYLSMVPLCCVTLVSRAAVEGQNLKKELHNLYSFSYPLCHHEPLKELVQKWFKHLEIKSKGTIFEDVSIKSVEKCLQAVSL